MTKNPLLNALAANLYIVLVILMINFGSQYAPADDNRFLAPVAMLSLLTLSVAMMAYIFGYQPFQLYFDGKKKQAVSLFLQTMAIFGGITILILLIVFSGVLGS